jgi:hypothetical protein
LGGGFTLSTPNGLNNEFKDARHEWITHKDKAKTVLVREFAGTTDHKATWTCPFNCAG